MKKIVLTLLFSSIVFAKQLTVSISIPPQKFIVEKIAKDLVEINLLVSPGNSPHTYEPKPQQMIAMKNSHLYLAIGVEFEKVWLKKFKDLNPSMKVFDISKGIKKIPIDNHHHKGFHHNHSKEETTLDPHIWTSLENAKIVGKNIFDVLAKEDSDNFLIYQKNYKNFLLEIKRVQESIQKILQPHQKRSFAVFHPSWGYFAQEFHLRQVAIEVEGKSPKAKQLISIIKELKDQNIKTLFTQPEFSAKAAKVIAKEIDGEVASFSPLAENYFQNLLDFAKAINKGYSK